MNKSVVSLPLSFSPVWLFSSTPSTPQPFATPAVQGGGHETPAGDVMQCEKRGHGVFLFTTVM